MRTVTWFRRDLRLGDNPAWSSATRSSDEVIALYVIDPALWDRASGPRRSVLADHLRALDVELGAVGGRLRVEVGDPIDTVPRVANDSRAVSVHWNADYTPYARQRDAAIESSVDATIHHGHTVHAPGTILTAEGSRYRVFTPFFRRWERRSFDLTPSPGAAFVAPEVGEGVPDVARSPMVVGERAAHQRLEAFDERIDNYLEERDRPDVDSTSRLSIDLKWGAIGPKTVIDRVGTHTPGREGFVRQLAWRDFYTDLLDATPQSKDAALRSEYRRIRWEDDPDGFAAWQQGRTGYPIVDAGMRQLLAEGWMHNRVRMIVASFLTKDLLVDWRRGERHFRHHLLDGDIASNVGNWQWAAGTGADAAPYFRIFNPVTQSKKFDPSGDYIRRWVPELRELAPSLVHEPWTAGPLDLAAAGIEFGVDYPQPIVDHAFARERALVRYKQGLGR